MSCLCRCQLQSICNKICQLAVRLCKSILSFIYNKSGGEFLCWWRTVVLLPSFTGLDLGKWRCARSDELWDMNWPHEQHFFFFLNKNVCIFIFSHFMENTIKCKNISYKWKWILHSPVFVMYLLQYPLITKKNQEVMETFRINEHLSISCPHIYLLFNQQQAKQHCAVCVSTCVCVCVISINAGSPAESISKWRRINWSLLSYLGPTAVPETEESDEALFCRVRVTAGAVCAGWVNKRPNTLRHANYRVSPTHADSYTRTLTSLCIRCKVIHANAICPGLTTLSSIYSTGGEIHRNSCSDLKIWFIYCTVSLLPFDFKTFCFLFEHKPFSPLFLILRHLEETYITD